jgi:hypothetical protein
MEIIILIILALTNGDVYSKVIQMPNASHKDCLAAGAAWLDSQKPEDSPQYLCLVKSDRVHTEDGGPAQ